MLRHRLIINFFLALWLTLSSSTLIAANQSLSHIESTTTVKHISIAVQSFLGKSVAFEKWQPMVALLNQQLKDYHFELFLIEAPNIALLRDLVEEGKLDYVITQPVATAELEFLSSVTPVLTKIDKRGVTQFGSVIIASAKNTKINSIQDLKGRSFAGANPVGLGGWILGYDYLLSQGVDLIKDASRVDFLGRQDNIVYAVLNGMVDAGVIRTGVLEKLSKDGKFQMSNIKVLDPKTDFPYFLTTNLVPEWSFSATTNADPILTSSIVKVLKQASYHPNKSNNLANWGEVADYQIIHQLLKKNKISVYKDPILLTILKKYYQFLLAVLGLLIISIWYLSKKRWKKIHQYKAELERLTRVGSVNQLLSEIAHEIAQPVTSIKIDAKIIDKLVKNTDTVVDDSIINVVNSLGIKTDHCVDVINNIRSFLTTKSVKREAVNINDRISSVLRLINHEINSLKITVKLYLDKELPEVSICHIELDQVLLNLCNNALSVMAENIFDQGTLTISTSQSNGKVSILIADTGHGVKNQDELFKLFKSDKELNAKEGLGLGLSLSRSIIRSYDGELSLNSTSRHGSVFLITLPKINES